MKKFSFYIPKHMAADVTRERSLKNIIFTRTRIVVLAFIFILSLSIAGTLAYLTYSANQTPNRYSDGKVAIRIGEKASLNANAVYDTDGEYDLGLNKKVVFVEAGNDPTDLAGNVTVSVIPEAESKTYSSNDGTLLADGYQTFAQEWSSLKQETIDGVTWDYIETSIMKVYLAQGWSTNWTFQKNNGIFKYNKTLKPGEKTDDLISGVILQDSVNKDTYRNIKLSMLVRSVYADTEG